LVRLKKTNFLVKGFPESPVTMAVGSGIIDIMMMKEADISNWSKLKACFFRPPSSMRY